MTNNPTIDGVSRELLGRAVCALQDEGRWELADLLEVAISAPSVERQPIKNASEVAYNLQAENAALQSTITRLEARVAELEIGRGEPSFYAQMGNSEYPEEWRGVIKKQLDRLNGYTVPLFTAPPAPVAVVLPQKSVLQDLAYKRYGYRTNQLCMLNGSELEWVWQACLDATAALNGSDK